MSFSASDLNVRYGGVAAVTDVSLTIEPGEIIGLIGPNGAGKTTIVDALTGFTRSSGEVTLDGVSLSQMRAARRARAGLARTFQAVELFDDLTIYENLLVAADKHQRGAQFLDIFAPRRSSSASVDHVLALVGIADLGELLPRDLSTGQRRLAGLARAVAAAPRYLLCDEPAAGLDTDESMAMGATLKTVAKQGTGILLIEHDMELVRETCDRVLVLDFGQCIFTGLPGDAATDLNVLRAFLGEDVSSAALEGLVGGVNV